MTKRIRDILSQGDYANDLETAFEKYNVDQLKMFRYASHDILNYLKLRINQK